MLQAQRISQRVSFPTKDIVARLTSKQAAARRLQASRWQAHRALGTQAEPYDAVIIGGGANLPLHVVGLS